MKKKDNEIDYGLEPTVKGLTTVYDVRKKPTEPTVNETIKTGVTGVTPSTNYMEGVIGDIGRGDFFSAGIKESNRNNKIDMGYDSEYAKTNWLNYNPKYQQQADKFRGQAQEYGDFEYDYRTDPQFLAMANLYGNNAKKAMNQALASASAANGGRLTSSAITAASQAYQDKMANVEQEVPQLRQAAYNMYNDDYNRIRTNMSDAENAGINDYNIWSDNYDRMYTNAWDLIKHDTNSKLTDSQIRSNEAVIKSTAFNDALLASEKTGAVTKGLADIIGVPEGTPMQAAKEFVEKYKLEVGNLLGYIPTGNVTDYGFENGGITFDNKQLAFDVFNNTGVIPGTYMSSLGYGDYGDTYTEGRQQMATDVYGDMGNYPTGFLGLLPGYGTPTNPNLEAQKWQQKTGGTSGGAYSGGSSSGSSGSGTSGSGSTGVTTGTMSTTEAGQIVNQAGSYVEKVNAVSRMVGDGSITESQANELLKGLGYK